MKKILIISIIILLIFAISLGLYYFFITSENKKLNNAKNNPADLFPFGGAGEKDPADSKDIKKDDGATNQTAIKRRLRLISAEPVSGETFVNTKKGLLLRYMEKASGNIYEVSTFDEYKERVSNQTIPQVQETYFSNNGDSFLARYMKNGDAVENFYANLSGTSTDKKIVGQIINGESKTISVSPSGKIFYLDEINNSGFGFLQSPPNTKKAQVFSSKLKDFNSQMFSDTKVLLVTKPTTNSLGYAYILDTQTGKLENLIERIYGLTAKIGKTGRFTIYSNSYNSNYFYLFDKKTKKTRPISPKTFPEKCIFDQEKENIIYCGVPKDGVEGSSLDDWYYGKRFFNDELWKYDLESGVSEKIIDFEESGREVDVDLIEISKDSSFVLVRSRIDGSLWLVYTLDI